MTTATLTKQALERQDFVDNEIFQLIKHLIPKSTQLKWDIEMISAVRHATMKQIVYKKYMSEAKFYPYLKI